MYKFIDLVTTLNINDNDNFYNMSMTQGEFLATPICHIHI